MERAGQVRPRDALVAAEPVMPAGAAARSARAGWRRQRALRIPSVLRIFLAYAAAFTLVYSPVLFTSYGFIDDYFQLASALQGATALGMRQHMSFGRPLQGLLIVNSFALMRDVGDIRWLRLVGILGIALLAWLLNRMLAMAGRGTLTALLVPLAIGMTLPFQVWAAWAMCAYFPYAAAIAGAAYLAVEAALRAHTRSRRLGFAGAAVFLLVASLAIYQPAAMVFWVVAAIRLLTADAPLHVIARVGSACLAVMCGSLALAYGLFQATAHVWPLFSAVPLHLQRAQVTHDPAGKATWFTAEVLVNAANLLQWRPSALEAALVYVALGGGLALSFSGSARERLGKLAVALALLPLCYLPNLITAEDWASYRTQAALTALLVVYAAMALLGYARAVPRLMRRTEPAADVERHTDARVERRVLAPLLAVACCAFAFVAATSVYQGFARPQQIEYAVLRQQLRAAPLAQARAISVLGAHYRDTAAGFVRYDEYGMPSSWYARATFAMTYLALRADEPVYAGLPVTTVTTGQAPPATFPSGTVVINLHVLKDYRVSPS